MSFGSGVRACIGWKFAYVFVTSTLTSDHSTLTITYSVYNIQSFLTEIIYNFHFEPTPELRNIRKESCILMVPIMEGQLDKGPQMPLKISLVKNDEY